MHKEYTFGDQYEDSGDAASPVFGGTSRKKRKPTPNCEKKEEKGDRSVTSSGGGDAMISFLRDEKRRSPKRSSARKKENIDDAPFSKKNRGETRPGNAPNSIEHDVSDRSSRFEFAKGIQATDISLVSSGEVKRRRVSRRICLAFLLFCASRKPSQQIPL